MEINIRKAFLSDAKQLDNFNRVLLSENYSIDFYNDILSCEHAACFIAEHDSVIIGYILSVLTNNLSKTKVIGHIVSIGISPLYKKWDWELSCLQKLK